MTFQTKHSEEKWELNTCRLIDRLLSSKHLIFTSYRRIWHCWILLNIEVKVFGHKKRTCSIWVDSQFGCVVRGWGFGRRQKNNHNIMPFIILRVCSMISFTCRMKVNDIDTSLHWAHLQVTYPKPQMLLQQSHRCYDSL